MLKNFVSFEMNPTGRAISTPMRDMRIKDLLKYLTAFAASSGVL